MAKKKVTKKKVAKKKASNKPVTKKAAKKPVTKKAVAKKPVKKKAAKRTPEVKKTAAQKKPAAWKAASAQFVEEKSKELRALLEQVDDHRLANYAIWDLSVVEESQFIDQDDNDKPNVTEPEERDPNDYPEYLIYGEEQRETLIEEMIASMCEEGAPEREIHEYIEFAIEMVKRTKKGPPLPIKVQKWAGEVRD